MKRFFLSFLVLCLVMSGFALADEPESFDFSIEQDLSHLPPLEDPLLTDPQSRYPDYGLTWDGSEQLIYMMLDMMNDELTLVQEHGSVTIHMDMYMFGQPMIRIDNTLALLNGWKLAVMTTDLDPQVVYQMPGKAYVCQDGELLKTEDYFDPESSDLTWESYIFPFAWPITNLPGLMMDETGYSYALAECDESMMEYVWAPDMTIVRSCLYEQDPEGVWHLNTCVTWEVGTAPEIPQTIMDAILADFPDPAPEEETEFDFSLE